MSDAAHATDAYDAYNPGFVIAGDTALPTGQLCRFTFTAGNTQQWYSRSGGAMLGTITSGSPVVLGAGFEINRLYERGSATFQLNQAGGSWADWVVIFPNATFEIITPNGTVNFTVAGLKGVGGSFITWRPTTAQQVILLAVSIGDSVTLDIDTPAPP